MNTDDDPQPESIIQLQLRHVPQASDFVLRDAAQKSSRR
jgi:hypothetical protein